MGTHPSGPSVLACAEGDARQNLPAAQTLRELIADHPVEMLGRELADKHGELPFLFKVLSIAEPLSIQAHPDLTLAAELHRVHPAHYPDANHKPEMAVALTPVELLYGFRPIDELQRRLTRSATLRLLLGETLSQKLSRHTGSDEEFLAPLYRGLLEAPGALLAEATGLLLAELDSGEEGAAQFAAHERPWLRRLLAMYPAGDVGVFSFLILRYLVLAPGEAVFIGPNVPHAYLGGELLECMASSDNVVRCGLTPKFRDTPTLSRMLVFRPDEPVRLPPLRLMEGVQAFSPPATEFAFLTIRPAERVSVQLGGPSLLLALEGEGTLRWQGQSQTVAEGSLWFLPNSAKSVSSSADCGYFAAAGTPNFWQVY